jgi:hypothetical protein
MGHFIYNRKANFVLISGGGKRTDLKILTFANDVLMWGRVKINLKRS